jgi:hypothetical protein
MARKGRSSRAPTQSPWIEEVSHERIVQALTCGLALLVAVPELWAATARRLTNEALTGQAELIVTG